MSRLVTARAALWVGTLCVAVALGWDAARAERVATEGYGTLSAGAFGAEPAAGPRRRPRLLWPRELSMAGLMPPVFARDGRLLVAGDAGVMGLDERGQMSWFHRLGAVRSEPLSLGADRFLVTTHNGRLWEVHADGTLRAWPVRYRALGAPVRLAQGGVAFVTDDGSIELVDDSGAAVNRIPTGLAGLLGLCAVGGSRVLVTGARGVRVLSMADGLVGRSDAVLRVGWAPRATGARTAWAPDEGGALLRLDGLGHPAGRVELPSPAAHFTAARDGGLRVVTDRNLLLALGPDGTERWRYALDRRGGEPALDADDTAYLVTRQGSLVSVDRDGALLFRVGTTATDAPRPALAPDGTLWLATARGSLQGWR